MSYIPCIPSALAVENPGIYLKLEDGVTDIKVGDSFDIDVKFNELGLNLTGIKLNIGYDATKMNLDSITYQAPFDTWKVTPNDQQVSDDKVTLERYNFSETAINNECIATLHFTALEAGDQISTSFIDAAGTPNGVGLTNNSNPNGINQSEYTIGTALEVNIASDIVIEPKGIDLVLKDTTTTPNPGESFDVDVKFNNLSLNLTGIILCIGYDHSQIQFDSVTYQAPFDTWNGTPNDQQVSDGKVTLERFNYSETAINDECIATLHFTRLESGEYISVGFIDDPTASQGVALTNNDNANGIPQSEYSIGSGVDVNLNQPADECFIATAAFGSKFQPAVGLLRQFRDQYLLTNSWGESFVHFYYRVSPPIAAAIAGHDVLRGVVRIALIPFIALAYLVMNVKLLVLLLMVASIYVYMKFKRTSFNRI